MLRLFVRLDRFDHDQASGMLTWPHSGFHLHTAVWVPEEDRAVATRLARYCARNPVALERLTYDRAAKVMRYSSDKSEGPTAGTATADPLEFLPRVLVHIPDKPHGTTVGTPTAPAEATRRCAALLPQIFEIDPLACPTCRGPMRIIACITQASVIEQILASFRARAAREPPAGPRSRQSTGPPRAGARHAPRARPLTPRPPLEYGRSDAPPPRGDLGVRSRSTGGV